MITDCEELCESRGGLSVDGSKKTQQVSQDCLDEKLGSSENEVRSNNGERNRIRLENNNTSNI